MSCSGYRSLIASIITFSTALSAVETRSFTVFFDEIRFVFSCLKYFIASVPARLATDSMNSIIFPLRFSAAHPLCYYKYNGAFPEVNLPSEKYFDSRNHEPVISLRSMTYILRRCSWMESNEIMRPLRNQRGCRSQRVGAGYCRSA